MEDETFDMIVLSVGLQTDPEVVASWPKAGGGTDPRQFLQNRQLRAGGHLGRASTSAAPSRGPRTFPSRWWMPAPPPRPPARFFEARNTPTKTAEEIPETNVTNERPRVGVFVCRCGINIAGVVDVPAVADYAADLALCGICHRQPVLLLPGHPGGHDPDHQAEKSSTGWWWRPAPPRPTSPFSRRP
jgi:heterodisulfide reductase subunit A